MSILKVIGIRCGHSSDLPHKPPYKIAREGRRRIAPKGVDNLEYYAGILSGNPTTQELAISLERNRRQL